ncbi:MAG: tetraacyldisaccharide 4'-kinase [Flavobacteriaceae bacterium]|nr:tetraacyldisaccharide 4'-kinase [Flavobacteriaceae bacterium]|tara:strand:- start:4009 stop:5037 length:1029 start_codon:yes stop_codon:yes gene_type:complete
MKVLRFFLFPFSLVYDIITSLRNLFYDIQLFKSVSFPIPIINVGNLSVGGTGKTPQVEYLVNLLHDDHKVAILSRGYKRKTKGYLLADEHTSVEHIGDEPFQYHSKFSKIRVAVCEKRVTGIRNLMNDVEPDVILLDDAFQHRAVRPSFNILLTKYHDLFVDDYVLPTGNLREARREAHRADCIVVTKCPENISQEDLMNLKNRFLKYNKPVFFSRIRYNDSISGSSKITFKELIDYEVLLITGIANPAPLLTFLKNKNIRYQHFEFPDHHHFTDKDLDHIMNSFHQIGGEKKLILTTEKDYVRLKDTVADLSYLGIEVEFINDSKSFDVQIIEHVKKFKVS